MFENYFGIDKRSNLELATPKGVLKRKPVVDIYETNDSVVVIAEMPNVNKSDIQVEVVDGKLHLSGKRSPEKIDGEILLRESRDFVYERFFALDNSLDLERITASYNLGVLKVEIRKNEKAMPRNIQIS